MRLSHLGVAAGAERPLQPHQRVELGHHNTTNIKLYNSTTILYYFYNDYYYYYYYYYYDDDDYSTLE